MRYTDVVRAKLLLLGVATFVPACVGMSVPTSNTSAPLWGALEHDVNRLGADYRAFDMPEADPELCRVACDDDPRCKAFTYVKPGLQGPSAKCWLKDSIPLPRANEGCCVSGVKPIAEPDQPQAPAAAP